MTAGRLILANGAALVLLLIVIYFSRATFRRVAGALAGGIAAVFLSVGQDRLALSAGWWHYPLFDTPYALPLIYTAAGLWYGAGVALIGWRVIRRFGGTGLAVFIAVMAVYGPVRDYAGARFTGAIVFAPGVVPALADAACWASGIALAQAVMRLLAGPADRDRLRCGGRAAL